MKNFLSGLITKKELLLEIKTFLPTNVSTKLNQVITPSDLANVDDKTPVKKVKDFKWPFYKLAKLNTTFTNYFYSMKDDKSELFSKSNLMFVIGPEKSGKSWFIKYNLRYFDNNNKLEPKPLILHWDLAQYNLLTFETFIHNFEKLFINTLSNRWKAEQEKRNKFLTIENILDVFLSKYEPTYVKYFLSKSLKAFLNDEEHFKVNEDNIDVFFETLDEISPKIYPEKEYIHEQLTKLITALLPQFDNNPVLASLTFLRSLTIAMELEQRPESYINYYYRNGIESIDFLFDVVDYISGYHKIKHYTDMDQMSPEFKDLIHSVLVLENSDAIFRNGYNEQRAKDFLDHILLRLYDDLLMRTHFPMVLETNDNRFFTRTVFNYLHEREDASYPTMEITGWMEDDQEKALAHIFTKDQLKKASEVFGTNLKDWHNFVNFLLTDDKVNFNDVVNFNHPIFTKEKNLFRNKLNKLYTHPLVTDMLDKGTLDFYLMDFFEKMASQLLQGVLYTGLPVAQAYFLDNPMIQALIDVGILYERKYISILQVSKRLYLYFICKFLTEKRNKMSIADKLAYNRFTKKHGLSRFMRDLDYGLVYKNNEIFEEPKADLQYEIKDYLSTMNKDPEEVMASSRAHFYIL